jgi:2,3-dihydroxy-p-cumate/2,3-dihydroxybenzoate 3,4-dioxygenase
MTRPRAPFGMEYARIAVPDLAATIAFLEYHIGLQLEQHGDDFAFLRADIEHHSIELRAEPQRDKAETVAVGFSVESSDALDELHDRITGAGHEVLPLAESMNGLCTQGFAVRDPNGLVVELFTEFAEYAEPPLVELRPVDLVHPFLATDRYDESLSFYTKVLGFQPSDYVGDVTVFLRSEDRYHHSLALNRNKDFFVAHLCFMMKSFDHVMRARARAQYKQIPIASDLVNHSASWSIAYYMLDERHGPRFELCDGHRVLTVEEHETTHRARRMALDPRNIDVWRAAADDWARF